MSGYLAFVDTNVMVYASDPSPSHKKELARKLVESLLDNDRIWTIARRGQCLWWIMTPFAKRVFCPAKPAFRFGTL